MRKEWSSRSETNIYMLKTKQNLLKWKVFHCCDQTSWSHSNSVWWGNCWSTTCISLRGTCQNNTPRTLYEHTVCNQYSYIYIYTVVFRRGGILIITGSGGASSHVRLMTIFVCIIVHLHSLCVKNECTNVRTLSWLFLS